MTCAFSFPSHWAASEHLAENADAMGTSNPWLARITCNIAMGEFAGFTAVVILTPDASIMVRLGVVLGVVAGGVLLLRRDECNPEKVDC
jgi:hypothetical protein